MVATPRRSPRQHSLTRVSLYPLRSRTPTPGSSPSISQPTVAPRTSPSQTDIRSQGARSLQVTAAAIRQQRSPELRAPAAPVEYTVGEFAPILSREMISETVDKYVQYIERRRRVMVDNGGAMEDWEFADLLLSNALLVFSQLAMDHTLWLGEHHPRELSLPAAVQKLGTAEQSHQQLRQQGSASAGDGSRGLPTRQVYGVGMHDQGKGRNSKKRKKSDKGHAPRKTIEQQKAESTCANCKAKGHWYGDPECPTPMTAEQAASRAKRDQKRRAVQNVRSFAGAALVNDQPQLITADSTEEKAATPIAGPSTVSIASTPTIGPLPVGGLEAMTTTAAAAPTRGRQVELVQEPQIAAWAVQQPEASVAAAAERPSTATMTLLQSSGSVGAVQSEDLVTRAEVVSAVGLSLVDMCSVTHHGWETMTTALVKKVFGKVAVEAIASYRKNADGPWSPTSPPLSPAPAPVQAPRQFEALGAGDRRPPAADIAW
ncbi:hypothetical protein ON010_g8187 [Phytophthora cinnamomi]|nr:hypothetical protein ON010_g8187 [Phytophthora cinnamomi]